MNAPAQISPGDDRRSDGLRSPARPGRRQRRASGFTILEVALASFVMLFGIVSALTALQAGFRMIDSARYTTLAGQILESQMEKLRLLTWDQLVNHPNLMPGLYNASGTLISTTTPADRFTPDISADPATQAIITNHFTCTQSIKFAPYPFDGTDGTEARQITLTATWTGSDGHVQSLSYFTCYAQNGISDFFYTTH